MRKWKAYCTTGLVALATLSSRASAQIPPPPPAPVPVAAVPPGTPAPPAFWSALGLTKDQKEAMKRKCCATPLGQLLNNMMAPVRVFSGGVVGNCCPTTPSPAALAQGTASAVGAAAAVQADEAQVAAKRAALRYLGTVDCHYWPEVAEALVIALRTERNECVRWEAARALGGGCCCTKTTIAALLEAATGVGKKYGPFTETCPRVQEMAFMSLQHCLSCYSEEVPVEPRKVIPELPGPVPEKPTAALPGKVQTSAHFEYKDDRTLAQVVAEARRAVSSMNTVSTSTAPLPPGSRSLTTIVSNAMIPRPPRHIEPAPAVRTKPVVGANSQAAAEPLPVGGSTSTPTAEIRPVVFQVAEPVAAPPAKPTPAPKPTPATRVAPRRLLPPQRPAPVMPQQQSQAPAFVEPEPYVALLSKSIYPFQREAAADKLASADWRNHPEVVELLLTTAKRDTAPTVRAACVRSLAKMRAATPAVVNGIQELRTDPDPRVVHEVETALARIGGVQQAVWIHAAQPAPAIQQMSLSSSRTGNNAR